jgi:hypothetical protein
MNQTDRRHAASHLNEAVRHLAAARVVLEHLDQQAELSSEHRLELSDVTSVVRVLAQHINDSLTGIPTDADYARMFEGTVPPGSDLSERPPSSEAC